MANEHAEYPLLCRQHASDYRVYHQIFIENEYSSLLGLEDVNLVIDCGANVGYSSAYFLSKFPGSRVVAVEPDPKNYRLLASNLYPYGKRAQIINSAIWSHTTGLVFSEEKYRDGREWSRQVRECLPSEIPNALATDIGQILRASGEARISILKMDIEGAEGVVFSKGYEEWLGLVDTLVIELHDDSCFGNCSKIFFRAIESQGFELSQCGELTVCIRSKKMCGDAISNSSETPLN